MNDEKLHRNKKKLDGFIKYSSIAFEMIAIMAFGVFIGIKLDEWLELSFPAFTLALMILFVAGAIYNAIRKFL